MASSDWSIPGHVPEDRVRDFNICSYEVHAGDVQAALRSLLDQPGPETFWSPYNGGHWVVTRAAVIDTVINDAERFSNRYIGVPRELNPQRIFRPFQMDPPDHLPYRRLLGRALSPRAVEVLKLDARRLTIELIEGFRARGECEFVSEFARHMPIGLFLSIVGLPMSDRLPLLAIAEQIARPQQEGDRMAGLDTVAGMLGFFARYLALDPARRLELREQPELIPRAVEELLRRFAHVNLTRLVRCDVEVDGAPMCEGDLVVAPLALYSLDEALFEDPMTVDFHRPPEPRHAAFGGEAHQCLGSLLARNELKIFLEEWLRRIPEFSIRPGFEVRAQTRVTAVLPELPLVWEP